MRCVNALLPFIAKACILFLVLLSSARWSYSLEVPALEGRVNDYAKLLSTATVSQLENSLKYFEQEDSTQIVVLTIPSLEGDNLETFSLRVAEGWQIGQKGLDNGALLLIARDERKLRIETGYGLEGTLTDLIAGRIIRNIILPTFKKGNFNQGVIDGVAAMMAAVKGEFKAQEVPISKRKTNDKAGFITMLTFFFLFLGNILRKKKWLAATVGGIGAPLLGMLFLGFTWLILLGLIPLGILGGLLASALMGSSSGRSGGIYWGGGGFGGGSSGGFGGFSGGGGGFGGGGASGGW